MNRLSSEISEEDFRVFSFRRHFSSQVMIRLKTTTYLCPLQFEQIVWQVLNLLSFFIYRLSGPIFIELVQMGLYCITWFHVYLQYCQIRPQCVLDRLRHLSLFIQLQLRSSTRLNYQEKVSITESGKPKTLSASVSRIRYI